MFIVIIVVVAVVVAGKTYAPPPSPPRVPTAEDLARSEAIRQVEAKAAMLFPLVQRAWGAGSMAPVRRWLSDSTYQRFELQLAIARRQGVRNVVENPELVQSWFWSHRAFGRYQSVYLCVQGRLCDYTVRVDDGTLVRGDRSPTQFEEVWTFARMQGAEGSGAAASSCPKCGAPVEDSGGTRCSRCAAIVNSGAYDWVLSAITQKSEYEIPPAVSPIEQKIAAIGTQHGVSLLGWLSPEEIEDRASAVFVRLHESFHDGRLADLAPFATQSLLGELEKSGRGRLGLHHLAIGAASLVDVAAEGEAVRATVRVKFSGCTGPEQPVSEAAPFEHHLVFTRNLNSKPSAAGLASLGCGSCGAPIESADQANCTYCKARLDSPDGAWILSGYEMAPTFRLQ